MATTLDNPPGTETGVPHAFHVSRVPSLFRATATVELALTATAVDSPLGEKGGALELKGVQLTTEPSLFSATAMSSLAAIATTFTRFAGMIGILELPLQRLTVPSVFRAKPKSRPAARSTTPMRPLGSPFTMAC